MSPRCLQFLSLLPVSWYWHPSYVWCSCWCVHVWGCLFYPSLPLFGWPPGEMGTCCWPLLCSVFHQSRGWVGHIAVRLGKYMAAYFLGFGDPTFQGVTGHLGHRPSLSLRALSSLVSEASCLRRWIVCWATSSLSAICCHSPRAPAASSSQSSLLLLTSAAEASSLQAVLMTLLILNPCVYFPYLWTPSVLGTTKSFTCLWVLICIHLTTSQV